MPRKGAATAAPPDDPQPTENLGSEETAAEASYNDSVTSEAAGEDKPAARPKRGGRKPKPETNGEVAEPDSSDKAIEDWTKPVYADDPGEFLFAEMDDADEWYSILWWGMEGTGKTTDTLLVTRILPPEGRVLLINAEAGAKRTALARHGVDTSRIALYPPKGQQLTFEGLERLFYRVQADLEKDPRSWGAVVWDSITAIYQKLLDDVIEADIRKQAEILQRANKGRTGRAGNITLRDRFETDRDDYASMSNQVRLLLRKYRALHCHLLITALERRDEDKKKKTVEYGPAISPALQVDLLGYMDVVIHTQVNDAGVFYGRSQPTESTRGKDRLNTLPVELVDPTVERIHRYVTGQLVEDADRAQRRLPDRETIVRRSLAEEYLDEEATGTYGPTDEERHHTKDGTPTGPPLAGEEDDPEPPKSRRSSSRRSRGASSTPAAAASPPPDESAPAEEPPKRGGRRARGGATNATPSTSAESAPVHPTPGETPPTTSGRKPRKTAAQRRAEAEEAAAREQAKEEGLIDKTPPKRGGRKTRTAAPKSKQRPTDDALDPPPGESGDGGFNDEPPF